MSKKWISVLMAACVLLSACGQNDSGKTVIGITETAAECETISYEEFKERTGNEAELYHGDRLSGEIPGVFSRESQPDETAAESEDALLLQKGSVQLKEMVEKQSEVLEGYGTFLAEYVSLEKESDSDKVPGFAITYLDSDDVPELIVIEGCAHSCGVAVYTFEKGEVIPIGVYGQYGTMNYKEKEGIVFDSFDTGDSISCKVYQMEEKKEILLQSYSERYEFSAEGEVLRYTYTVDGKEVSEEQYREVCDKWQDTACRVIDHGMCLPMTDDNIQQTLTKELENLILTQEKVLKQNVLIEADMPESSIIFWDYDDYDRDGKCEVFVICGESGNNTLGVAYYRGTLYFAGADGCTVLRDYEHYRMIDGKMKLGPGRKYLFFYTDYNFTANITELWTVEDGKPVESEFSQIGQVVYRGGNDFEIWKDAYDHFFGMISEDSWTGHTYKPYFYYYNYSSNRVEAYGGEEISGEAFEQLSGTNIIEEIESKGYTVGTIIRWENDIVTINYAVNENTGSISYENIIWDNRIKDFWEKEIRGVTSWENAGVGGSFHL